MTTLVRIFQQEVYCESGAAAVKMNIAYKLPTMPTMPTIAVGKNKQNKKNRSKSCSKAIRRSRKSDQKHGPRNEPEQKHGAI